jgi:hypothetical protein
LEEQSEAKGFSPKSKVKRIGLFQKFGKMKQSEVNLLQILQDRSKTNVFVPNCVKEEKLKNEASFFFEKKRRKTNLIVPHLSKICHCYSRQKSVWPTAPLSHAENIYCSDGQCCQRAKISAGLL